MTLGVETIGGLRRKSPGRRTSIKRPASEVKSICCHTPLSDSASYELDMSYTSPAPRPPTHLDLSAVLLGTPFTVSLMQSGEQFPGSHGG